jgi:hypothetical protein
MGRTVYVAEQGCYEQQSVVGIFDSPERAIAALHKKGDAWKRTKESANYVIWENDKDWDSYISITATEFTDEGELKSPDSAVVRKDSADGMRVEYIPEPV